jgi:membrane complex biogenesis BtpA family protein
MPLFNTSKPIIAMIHVAALPGTPGHYQSMSDILASAIREAQMYRAAGVDAIGIENMHDVPYLKGHVGPEIVAAMTLVGQAVKAESGLPVGVQILAGANREAVAVAHAAQLDFARVEGFVFAHVADEGIIESSAAELLRYRKQIGAERVQIFADIKKKHSAHAITADVPLGDTAHAAEFMRADAVIVTGTATGSAPQLEDAQEAKAHCHIPVLLGSGIDADNLAHFYAAADGFIIGSYFKIDGHWANTIDPKRVERFMEKVREERRGK